MDGDDVGLAQASCRFRKRVEYLLQIERGTADDLEHVRGRGLLLQRLGQIARPRLHFFEQPDIAERDYRLIGERLQQGDLLVAERLNVGAAQHDRTDAL